ncbi:MAG: preprotein translocase subunit SecG [Ruminococcus sp.]
MEWYFIALGALILIAAVALILVVILQEGNSKGVGVVSGGADTFFNKNKARSIDAFLSRWTKFFAVGFFILVLAVNVIAYFTMG